jgi:hypothetical protein
MAKMKGIGNKNTIHHAYTGNIYAIGNKNADR